VELLVQDTGTGLSEEARSHLFEPFFTTKQAGRGSGLGLATVYGIVSQNGGTISVDSAPGKGTAVRILLPALAPGSAPPQTTGGADDAPRGSETVLLVEDSDMVRRVVSVQLEALGYTVFSFPDGEAALAWAAGYPQTIHLLVSDVVMPGMNGRSLAKRLVGARPGTRVLFLSGYTDDSRAQHEALEAGAFFLAKPFSRHGLATKVREALAQI
jgi:CheY-like chemotaxis protein